MIFSPFFFSFFEFSFESWKKSLGSAPKNRVGRETGNKPLFFLPNSEHQLYHFLFSSEWWTSWGQWFQLSFSVLQWHRKGLLDMSIEILSSGFSAAVYTEAPFLWSHDRNTGLGAQSCSSKYCQTIKRKTQSNIQITEST